MERRNRKRVTAILCCAAMLLSMGNLPAAYAEDTNMITNADFEAGIDGWGMYHHTDADAELSAQDGLLALTVRELGSVNYAVQLSSNAMTIEEGKSYQVTFDISSTQERYVDAIVQQNGGSYTAYGAQGITLTPEVQTVSFTFEMKYETGEAKLIFNCGDHNEVLPEHTIHIDNVSVQEVEAVVYDPYEPSILINQVGYRPDMQKTAVFRDVTNETTFSIMDAATGESVYTGELYGEFEDTTSDEVHWYGDFSDLTTPGTYYITCGELDASYAFTIEEDPYGELLDSTVRMLYLQRCGCAVEDEVYGHSACHTALATIYGTEETIDVSGGWHDAGDYGRFVVPAAKAVADLMLAYDVNPSIHSDAVGIPESGNGIPDILDETRYELEWMLKMQAASGGVYHMVNCPGNSGTVMPEKETGAIEVKPVSTTATADFCAVMAMAAEYYDPFDAAFAESCLAASKAAWGYLQENPTLTTFDFTDAYTDYRDGDERYWAACQLYRATGDTAYLDAIADIQGTYYKDGLEWHMVGQYGNIALLTLEGMDTASEHYQKAEEMLYVWVREYLSISSEMGYQTGIETFTWGSNMSIANAGIVLRMADLLEGGTQYADTAQLQLDYLLGRNPNGICYVTGFGTVSPVNPHHRPSIAQGQAMPGMLVGGVNSSLADPIAEQYLADAPPAKCYVDMQGSYTTNEITIYWNSPLIYLLSLTMEPVEEPEDVIGDVNADGSFTVLDVVLLQKWLLAVPDTTLPNWKAGDFDGNGKLNGFDLAMMKRTLLQ